MELAFTADLTAQQLEEAGAMTFPSYRPCLGAEDHSFLAALVGQEVVGLVLWRMANDGRVARLLSILVRSDYRRQGVGSELLSRSIKVLGESVENLAAYWSSTLPGADAFERLLLAAGWSEKVLDQCRVSGTAQSARDWAHRRQMDRMLMRAGWSFTSFEDLPESERSEVELAVSAAQVPEGWRPFEDVPIDQALEPKLSIVMRQHGDVVGWLTTCRTESGEIWYYRLYNIGAGKAAGALMPLIVEVNRRHFELDGPNARWRWNTSSNRPEMLAFLARHAAEFCDFHDYYWTSRRVLRSEADNLVGEIEQVETVS